MSDIFREVDEDLRHEHYRNLWHRYGRYVIAGLVLLILGTAATVFWQNWRADLRTAETEALARAALFLEGGERDKALSAFEALAAEAETGAGVLARLRAARLHLEKGATAAAVVAYDQVTADRDVDPLFRDLARLLAVMALADEGKPAALRERLAPLLEDADNPWRFSAREMDGYLLLKSGDREGAREIFRSLADDQAAPAGLRSRMLRLSDLLGGA